jgi:hypothetical protein
MEEHSAPVYEMLRAQQKQMDRQSESHTQQLADLKELFMQWAAPPERGGQRGP